MSSSTSQSTTPSKTRSSSSTATRSQTSTHSPTGSQTGTPTLTVSRTMQPTPSKSLTQLPTRSLTASLTKSSSMTASQTPSQSSTGFPIQAVLDNTFDSTSLLVDFRVIERHDRLSISFYFPETDPACGAGAYRLTALVLPLSLSSSLLSQSDSALLIVYLYGADAINAVGATLTEAGYLKSAFPKVGPLQDIPAYYKIDLPSSWTIDTTSQRRYSIVVSTTNIPVHWYDPAYGPAYDNEPLPGFGMPEGASISLSGNANWDRTSFPGFRLEAQKVVCSPTPKPMSYAASSSPSQSSSATSSASASESASTSESTSASASTIRWQSFTMTPSQSTSSSKSASNSQSASEVQALSGTSTSTLFLTRSTSSQTSSSSVTSTSTVSSSADVMIPCNASRFPNQTTCGVPIAGACSNTYARCLSGVLIAYATAPGTLCLNSTAVSPMEPACVPTASFVVRENAWACPRSGCSIASSPCVLLQVITASAVDPNVSCVAA